MEKDKKLNPGFFYKIIYNILPPIHSMYSWVFEWEGKNY